MKGQNNQQDCNDESPNRSNVLDVEFGLWTSGESDPGPSHCK
ncbi:MAG: hypothetical protein RLZZ416_145 [Candidatus Parcubacteria bacterium]